MSYVKRILVISNLYPPHYLGGYELGCRDVVDGLRQRGHEVRVITSVFRKEDVQDVEDGVARVLRWDPSPTGRPSLVTLCGRYRQDLCALRKTRRVFSPDAVLVFNTWGLWQGILDEIQLCQKVQCAHLVSDYALERSLARDPWLQFWRHRPSSLVRRVVKGWIETGMKWMGWPLPDNNGKPFPVRIFTSQFVQAYHEKRGLKAAKNRVVYWGVPLDHFVRPRTSGYQGRFLFSGQLRKEKGLNTLVEAMGLIPADMRCGVSVSVAGGTQEPAYVKSLEARVDELGLSDVIRFFGHVPHERLPDLYADHDVLLFCSEWDEPFSIALLEGMTSGLIVIGTTTGGSCELLRNGVNAWTYPAGNVRALADAILSVHRDPESSMVLAKNGSLQIQRSYGIQEMVNQVEAVLF